MDVVVRPEPGSLGAMFIRLCWMDVVVRPNFQESGNLGATFIQLCWMDVVLRPNFQRARKPGCHVHTAVLDGRGRTPQLPGAWNPGEP